MLMLSTVFMSPKKNNFLVLDMNEMLQFSRNIVDLIVSIKICIASMRFYYSFECKSVFPSHNAFLGDDDCNNTVTEVTHHPIGQF
jgi:hypothetical protein